MIRSQLVCVASLVCLFCAMPLKIEYVWVNNNQWPASKSECVKQNINRIDWYCVYVIHRHASYDMSHTQNTHPHLIDPCGRVRGVRTKQPKNARGTCFILRSIHVRCTTAHPPSIAPLHQPSIRLIRYILCVSVWCGSSHSYPILFRISLTVHLSLSLFQHSHFRLDSYVHRIWIALDADDTRADRSNWIISRTHRMCWD